MRIKSGGNSTGYNIHYLKFQETKVPTRRVNIYILRTGYTDDLQRTRIANSVWRRVGKNSFLRGGILSMQKKITEYQTI